MGIAKTMNAIGEYHFYSSDYKQFAEIIGELLSVNIHAHFFDNVEADKEEYADIEEEYFNLQFPETYRLRVEFFNFDEKTNLPENRYCVYELKIPVELENESELSLTFYPNGIYQLDFLPFSNYWKFFVEDLIGVNDHYYNTHDEIVSAFLNIRECYIEILGKINCSEIIIWTDAYYQAENEFLYNQEIGKKYYLSDVKKGMEELDGIKIIPFIAAIKQEIKITSQRKDYFDIAFLDKIE